MDGGHSLHRQDKSQVRNFLKRFPVSLSLQYKASLPTDLKADHQLSASAPVDGELTVPRPHDSPEQRQWVPGHPEPNATRPQLQPLVSFRP